jgi:hypothetical protein
MNGVSNVVSIRARVAPPARSIKHAVRPGPLVFIVDRPKTYVLAAIFGATALLVVGALASDLLRMPRSFACEADPASAKEASHWDLRPPTPARLKD